MRNKLFAAVLFLFSMACVTITARADTLFFNDGSEQKGIVVENYHDRVVLSTIDGEKEFAKSGIKDIAHDRQEQNLVKLGDFHQEKGNLKRAYAYYEKAYTLNPEYKEAKEKFVHLRAILLRSPQKQLENDIARKQAIFKESGKIYETSSNGSNQALLDDKFKEATGITLSIHNGMPRVESVLAKSSAAEGGLKRYDIIVSVWGRMTGYLSAEDIINIIMSSPSPEVAMDIKRRISIKAEGAASNDISGPGFGIEIEEEGLVVSEIKDGSKAAKSGLNRGDLIAAINERPTRYMPLKEALSLINAICSRNDILNLDVVRSITLWRKNNGSY